MGQRSAPWRVGLVPIGAGTVLLPWCVREFYVVGRGTLAPWAPPQRLVTSGPYHYSRNPVYLAVATLLVGWAVYFRSSTLRCYALIVVVAFRLRTVLAVERPNDHPAAILAHNGTAD